MRGKIITAVLAIAFTGMAVAFAIAPSDLSSEDRAKFDSQALSIQTSESMKYYADVWGSPLYWELTWDLAEDHPWLYFAAPYSFLSPFAFRSYSAHVTKWEPFRGFTKISKYDFYNTIGLPNEAERYLKFQNERKVWGGVTWGSFVVGTGLLVAGLCVEDPLSTYFLVSAGALYTVSSVGFTVLEFGLIEEKEFSVSFAVNAAQTYNQKLLEGFAK